MLVKTRAWILLGLLLLLGAGCLWHFARDRRAPGGAPFPQGNVDARAPSSRSSATNPVSVRGASGVGAGFWVVATNVPNLRRTNNLLRYRLSNTREALQDLVRNGQAVLLRNAFIDTAAREGLEV